MAVFWRNHWKQALIGMLILALLAFFLWPIRLTDRLPEKGVILVTWREDLISADEGSAAIRPDMTCTNYRLEADSEEAAQMRDILSRYTCHRSWRTLIGDTIDGGGTDGWLFLMVYDEKEGAEDLLSNGSGEIFLGGRIYHLGYWGDGQARAMQEEVRALLETCTPEL
ncbi:MAG: hypothetical protein ACI3VN_02055 [Candidatus Onthomonas sp.]